MTPEQIIELVDDCGASVYKYQSVARLSVEFGSAALVKFVKLIEAATREECANVCDERANGENDAQWCADRIRSMK